MIRDDPTVAAHLAQAVQYPLDDVCRLSLADRLQELDGRAPCRGCHGKGFLVGPPYQARVLYLVPDEFGPEGQPLWKRECPGCGGRGSVSDGSAEWAEFIRVQVELARTPETVKRNRLCHQREWDALRSGERPERASFSLASPADRVGVMTWEEVNPALQPLSTRQQELWEAASERIVAELPLPSRAVAMFADQFARWETPAGDIDIVYRRGLPSELVLTVDAFLAGGLGLFAVLPIARVSLVRLTIHASLGNDTFYLGDLGRFPRKYWQRLDGMPSWGAVRDQANAVCLEHGREMADLPPLVGGP